METSKYQKNMISPKEEELKVQKKPGEGDKIFDKEKRRFKKGITKR
ncbi:hypothetical protein QTN47_27565 [Danxiaibacter flavus]|uniref:Uncharacterized protein n=1 Tax=Danxiaibacter flavus TaxID=3049108 RepID=A0ABV3ZN43_9BACT|nr:hypothetical protein QNM32_27565 [Chitinophagaceae bacterium DXS]